MNFRKQLCALAVGCAATIVPLTGQALDSQAIDIVADGGRPLAKVLDELERRFGWVITYEEPPYVHPSDVRDVTRETRRDYSASSAAVVVPNGRPFRYVYTGVPNEEAVLQELLKTYKDAGNAAEFRLERTGTLFHLVASAARNRDGQYEGYQALLDARISIPDADRTAFEMIRAIASAVESKAATKVILGSVPTNVLIQTRLHEGAQNETARAVLIRCLQATNAPLSWRVLYGPGNEPMYALNIHYVKRRE